MEQLYPTIQHNIDQLKNEFALNSKDLDTLIKLAQCMVDTKNYQEAETYLNHIDQITPDNATIKLFLGNVCYEQNKFQEAISWFANSVELNPFNSQVYLHLGFANNKLLRFQDAILNFEKNLEFTACNEERLKSYNALGIIHLNQGEANHAIKYFTKALEIAPDSENILINLTSALIYNSDFEQALSTLAQIPDSSVINFLRVIQQSRIFKALGQTDKAILYLEEHIKKEPQHTAALYAQLGEIYEELEEHLKAEECYKLALPEHDNKPMILLRLADLTSNRQEYKTAKDYLSEILYLNPGLSTVYTKLADICLKENNFDGAINCANIAISINPNETEAYLIAEEGLRKSAPLS